MKNHSGGGVSLTHNKNFRKLLKEIIGDTAPRLTELNTKEFAGFQVGLLNKVNYDINSLLGWRGKARFVQDKGEKEWEQTRRAFRSLAEHLVLSKISIRHVVHTKGPLKSGPIIFGSCQMDRTKYQGHLGMCYMSYEHFGQHQV